jgi:hypothetical protein
MWDLPLMSTGFGCFLNSICESNLQNFVGFVFSQRQSSGLVLPLFLAAQGPASPAEQMGGQGRQQLQRLVNGQLAALPLLVSSAKTGRRQAPVGLVTAAVTSMATIDEAAASLTQCMSGDAISDVIVKCERWAPQLHRTALL